MDSKDALLHTVRPLLPQGTQTPLPLGDERPLPTLLGTEQTSMPFSSMHGRSRRPPHSAQSTSCQLQAAHSGHHNKAQKLPRTRKVGFNVTFVRKRCMTGALCGIWKPVNFQTKGGASYRTV